MDLDVEFLDPYYCDCMCVQLGYGEASWLLAPTVCYGDKPIRCIIPYIIMCILPLLWDSCVFAAFDTDEHYA